MARKSGLYVFNPLRRTRFKKSICPTKRYLAARHQASINRPRPGEAVLTDNCFVQLYPYSLIGLRRRNAGIWIPGFA